MKNLIEWLKKWFGFWIWFIFIMCFSVFAYQFNSYVEIADVSNETKLTKDMFNQLLANIRDIDSRLWTNKTYAVRYYLPANAIQTINKWEWTKINFSWKDYDYYNLVTTWTNWNYKVPEDWLYLVSSCVAAVFETSWQSGNNFGLAVLLWSSSYNLDYHWTSTYNWRWDTCGSKVLKANKDQLISFRYIWWNPSSTINIWWVPYNADLNYAEITKIWN